MTDTYHKRQKQAGEKQGRGTVWSEEELNFLRENYRADKKQELIGKLNRRWPAITHMAGKLGFKFDKSGMTYNVIWTDEEETYLIDNYASGDLKEIAEKLGRTKKAITERAKLLKIQRDYDIVRKQCHHYTINEDFFKVWSDDMAYILGLIWTDGCILDNDYCVDITQHVKDKYILEKINTLIGSNRPIRRDRNTSVFAINNKIIYEDLLSLGLIQRKSKTVDVPINLPSNHIPSFIRGVMDGDGSVNTKAKRMRICTASKKFADGICGMLSQLNVEQKTYNMAYVLRDSHKVKKQDQVPGDIKTDFYVIEIIRRDSVKKLYHLMYDNQSLYLDRKKESFDKMCLI